MSLLIIMMLTMVLVIGIVVLTVVLAMKKQKEMAKKGKNQMTQWNRNYWALAFANILIAIMTIGTGWMLVFLPSSMGWTSILLAVVMVPMMGFLAVIIGMQTHMLWEKSARNVFMRSDIVAEQLRTGLKDLNIITSELPKKVKYFNGSFTHAFSVSSNYGQDRFRIYLYQLRWARTSGVFIYPSTRKNKDEVKKLQERIDSALSSKSLKERRTEAAKRPEAVAPGQKRKKRTGITGQWQNRFKIMMWTLFLTTFGVLALMTPFMVFMLPMLVMIWLTTIGIMAPIVWIVYYQQKHVTGCLTRVITEPYKDINPLVKEALKDRSLELDTEVVKDKKGSEKATRYTLSNGKTVVVMDSQGMYTFIGIKPAKPIDGECERIMDIIDAMFPL